MLKNLACCAVVVPLVAAVSGCLFESTLDANGGGVMTITIRINKPEDLMVIKKQLEGSAVKVTNAEQVGGAEGLRAVYKVQFDDVTKLSSSEFFKSVTFTRVDGAAGTKVLTAMVRREKTAELSDAALEKLGKEVKVVVTLPGPIVESNGTISGGNTVTWTWGMKEFHKQREVMMTVAYKPPAVTPSAATPAATTGS